MITPQGNVVVGKKGRSGRKSIAEELKGTIELITQKTLADLANKVVYKRLQTIEDPLDPSVKDIALPVALKGMTDKKDITSDGKPIVMPNTLIEKNGSGNTTPSTGGDSEKH